MCTCRSLPFLFEATWLCSDALLSSWTKGRRLRSVRNMLAAVCAAAVAFATTADDATGMIGAAAVNCLKSEIAARNGRLDISPCLLEMSSVDLLFSSDSKIRSVAINNSLVLNYTFAHLYELVPPAVHDMRRTIVLTNSADRRFVMQGGIRGDYLSNLTLQIDGTLDFGGCVPMDSAICRLKFTDYPGFNWDPRKASTPPMLHFSSNARLKLTSKTRGRIVGGGEQWYGLVNILRLGDAGGRDKPIMLDMRGGHTYGLEISNLSFEQPAYWTTYLDADDVHIHHSNVTSRVMLPMLPKPFDVASDWLEEIHRIMAWNTDGFDINGNNVHIHDCVIQTSDDCIAVKGGKNWVVERIVASGAGLTIGMAGSASNITFRNINMSRSIHGLYIKADAHNVTYEDITIYDTALFPIWVGPAWQELDGGCPLLFPFVPTSVSDSLSKATGKHLTSLCHPNEGLNITNLIFRNIAIVTSRTAPVVLFGGRTPLDVTFDNVTVAGELPSHSSFPLSKLGACYNASVKPAALTAPGALLGECAPSAPLCVPAGQKRGHFTPCCNESAWDPKGKLPDEWYGVCR